MKIPSVKQYKYATFFQFFKRWTVLSILYGFQYVSKQGFVSEIEWQSLLSLIRGWGKLRQSSRWLEAKIWSNTYDHNMKPLRRKQSLKLRFLILMLTNEHTSTLFAQFKLLRLQVHIKLQTLCFMHQFVNGKLPKTFDLFFI